MNKKVQRNPIRFLCTIELRHASRARMRRLKNVDRLTVSLLCVCVCVC